MGAERRRGGERDERAGGFETKDAFLVFSHGVSNRGSFGQCGAFRRLTSR